MNQYRLFGMSLLRLIVYVAAVVGIIGDLVLGMGTVADTIWNASGLALVVMLGLIDWWLRRGLDRSAVEQAVAAIPPQGNPCNINEPFVRRCRR
jgi:hypothetical protein